MPKTISSILDQVKLENENATSISLVTAFNQFEGNVYNIVDEYKTLYYPRVKGKSYFDLPVDSVYKTIDIYTETSIKWDDIREIYIKDSNDDFQKAKKITDRDSKIGSYYWNNNNSICIPPQDKTDPYFTMSDNYVMQQYSNIYNSSYEFTSNSVKGDFTYFCVGMQITIIGVNAGEYVVLSLSASEMVLENATFTTGTYLVTILGAAIQIDFSNVAISKGDYFVKRYQIALVNNNYEHIDYLVKCTYSKLLTSSTIISYAYGSVIDSTRMEVSGFGASPIMSVFIPGIRITYKKPFYPKLESSTAHLLLPDTYSDAYNYFIASKIYEYQKNIAVARYKRNIASNIIERFKETYKENKENYPADDIIQTTW